MNEPNSKPPKRKPAANYGRYIGMAFQMIAVLLLGAFSGMWLDNNLNTSPLFLVALLLGSVVLSLYIVVKDFMGRS